MYLHCYGVLEQFISFHLRNTYNHSLFPVCVMLQSARHYDKLNAL